MGIEDFCVRCKGGMTAYDKRWAVKGMHPDAWKCADWFEKRVKELEQHFSDEANSEHIPGDLR